MTDYSGILKFFNDNKTDASISFTKEMEIHPIHCFEKKELQGYALDDSVQAVRLGTVFNHEVATSGKRRRSNLGFLVCATTCSNEF